MKQVYQYFPMQSNPHLIPFDQQKYASVQNKSKRNLVKNRMWFKNDMTKINILNMIMKKRTWQIKQSTIVKYEN